MNLQNVDESSRIIDELKEKNSEKFDRSKRSKQTERSKKTKKQSFSMIEKMLETYELPHVMVHDRSITVQ